MRKKVKDTPEAFSAVRAHNIGRLESIGTLAGDLMCDYGRGITVEQKAKLFMLISCLKGTEHEADRAIRPVAAGRGK